MKTFTRGLLILCVLSTSLVLSQDEDAPVDFSSVDKMDRKEKDKILSCVEIISSKLKKDQGTINSVAQGLADLIESNVVSQKITGDMLSKCYNSIDDSTVSTIFRNGDYLQPEFDEDLQNFATVDYNTYRSLNPNEFNLSPETELLFAKLDKAKNEYTERVKATNSKGKAAYSLLGFNLRDIPLSVNIIFAIVSFGVFICGIVYLLKMVSHNDKRAGKKKTK